MQGKKREKGKDEPEAMKMGVKGSASSLVVKPSLRLIALVSLGFFFGFLSALSFNQQFCFTNSWYSQSTDPHSVTKSHNETSNIVQEDTTTQPTFEQESVRAVAEPACPPCEAQSEKLSLMTKEILPQLDTSVSNEMHHNCTSGVNENSAGSVCRSPTLADKLPQTFVHKTTDFHFHRLVGTPENDVKSAPKNLLALAVGIKQNMSVDAIVKKFPKEIFQIILFHYDNTVDEWSQFEWNDRVIHVQSTGQSKWWFAKRFLHPDVVAPYNYVFVWDEDLGVDNFDPLEYIEIMKRHELQISQPAVEGASSWPITIRRYWTGKEVHKHTTWEGLLDNCTLSQITPPCAGFVEIQAPVFERKAWRCVWHLIQNDLVMAWGLDFQLQACIDGAPHEHIGIVDTQWIVHNKIPSLGSQGAEANNPKRLRGEVIARSILEWKENKRRWAEALASQKENYTSQQ